MIKNNYQYIEKHFLDKSKALFRFGSIGDGGYYLSPNILLESDLLFSGGISSNLEFEFDFYRFNTTASILMIDPTVSKWRLLIKGIFRLFLNKKRKLPYLYNVFIFWDITSKKRCKHLPLFLDASVSILDLIKKHLGTKNAILLKLDIEGSEYDFLEEILLNLDIFSAIIFEFHDFHVNCYKVIDFLERSSNKFSLVFLGINPSGGYDGFEKPKCIELTLERK
ncbi:FkbM family methyltransferase [Siansivirga zeaxanthinifaciens]|nr:FkbM family methyltransferase [Siansivirga zeaxanthinifaciens]